MTNMIIHTFSKQHILHKIWHIKIEAVNYTFKQSYICLTKVEVVVQKDIITILNVASIRFHNNIRVKTYHRYRSTTNDIVLKNCYLFSVLSTRWIPHRLVTRGGKGCNSVVYATDVQRRPL